MSGFWTWLFCTHPGTISALLGAAGSLLLAVPWAVDVRLRRESEYRMAEAEAAHGDHPLVDTLRRLHLGLLLGAGARWVAGLAFTGALLLAGSFVVILGSTLRGCG